MFDYLDIYCQTSAMNCPEKNPVIVLTGRLLFRLCKLSCLLHSVGCGPNFSICDGLGQVVSVIDELFMYLCTCIVGIFRRQSRPLYAIVGFDRVERWPTEVRLLPVSYTHLTLPTNREV